MQRLLMVWGLALAMLGAVACGDDGGDGGGDDDDDYVFPDLPVAQVGDRDDGTGEIDEGTAVDADFSCLGDERVVGDTEVTVSFELADGLNRNVVNTNAAVMILADNAYAEPFEADGRTDASGIFSFQAFENQLFGIRFIPDDDSAPAGYAESVQYNGIASENMVFEASSAQTGVIRLLPTTVGAPTVSAGNGIISAALEDCSGGDVYGVHVRFFSGDGTVEYLEGPAFAIRYFDGIGDGSPTQGRDFTHVDGRYAAINLPGGEDTLVGIYGRTTDGGPIELLSCERFFTLAVPSADDPNITIATSRPLRPETASLPCPAP